MSEDNLDKLLASMAQQPRSGPSRAPKKEVTYDEFQKMLDSTPLFMRETPDGTEENEVLEALRTLVFDGEGDEVALNFKNHGNELHAQKSYKDAVKAYTDGLEAGPSDQALRISLLNNRAACNLSLKNYGAVLKDTGVIIALSAKDGIAPPVKAVYRAAQSLVALERWEEAQDAIARGKELEGDKGNAVWAKLENEAERGMKRSAERKERERREMYGKLALQRAIDARGLITVKTGSPPDNPHPLHFDPEALPPELPLYDPNSTQKWVPPPASTPLVFPVFLLYPQHSQSDLITHFHEDTSFEDQLNDVFAESPAWDTVREYTPGNLVVYAETRARRLLKVGKELTLREVLAKAARKDDEGKEKDGVVLRDGLLSFVVLVKGTKEKEWIDDFKSKRDQNNA
ncbi:hypothetical protein BCR39DRAFT_542841 [Naematelia encephala]|uniref:Cns1/TTC4 wheel domain-containing protein n=1 Tax=Naematelia encephala TaxID=71784 RepID=A0A1Y2AV67_9TREE|nr:hypothetical protein BCR39DRAFT_542841 [Naematelia encephala]